MDTSSPWVAELVNIVADEAAKAAKQSISKEESAVIVLTSLDNAEKKSMNK
jgi:hypothetical protein